MGKRSKSDTGERTRGIEVWKTLRLPDRYAQVYSQSLSHYYINIQRGGLRESTLNDIFFLIIIN